jgi:UDP-N-acetylmuramate--alanine ligase
MYPQRKLTVVFQPHLYTRTRDFAEGFAKSLSLADELFLMDIYPARELPIPGVDSDMIMKQVTSKTKVRCTKSNLLLKLNGRPVEVIATVGAGDIDTCVQPLKRKLEEAYGL